jgi:hypothetical protein
VLTKLIPTSVVNTSPSTTNTTSDISISIFYNFKQQFSELINNGSGFEWEIANVKCKQSGVCEIEIFE